MGVASLRADQLFLKYWQQILQKEEDFAEFADADEPESNAVFYRIRTRLPDNKSIPQSFS